MFIVSIQVFVFELRLEPILVSIALFYRALNSTIAVQSSFQGLFTFIGSMELVHKEFLLNQWVERIQEFLPNAKIGRIQGKILNVEGCDIVMGMIQSISTKEYENMFDKFGLTIIDEVHHMGAEVFSNALNKIFNFKFIHHLLFH